LLLRLSLAKQHTSSDAAAIMQAKLLACVDKSGCTPLHLAAIYDNRNCVQALLAAGAHLEAVDDKGQTPLHSAASFGHVEVVEVLLARSSSPASALSPVTPPPPPPSPHDNKKVRV
jgi:ankyrin repeat protein